MVASFAAFGSVYAEAATTKNCVDYSIQGPNGVFEFFNSTQLGAPHGTATVCTQQTPGQVQVTANVFGLQPNTSYTATLLLLQRYDNYSRAWVNVGSGGSFGAVVTGKRGSGCVTGSQEGLTGLWIAQVFVGKDVFLHSVYPTLPFVLNVP